MRTNVEKKSRGGENMDLKEKLLLENYFKNCKKLVHRDTVFKQIPFQSTSFFYSAF